MIVANCKRYGLPLVYVNQVGAQTELIFDGGSMIADAAGNIIAQLPYFEESLAVVDIEFQKPIAPYSHPEIQRIHDAIVMGIKDYFTKLGFSKAVLGLSGGIDRVLNDFSFNLIITCNILQIKMEHPDGIFFLGI